jgi:GT2 family glycosyltransferase
MGTPSAPSAGTPSHGTGSITVIMPTCQRPEALERALAALAGQSDPGLPWSLIVVDNDPAAGATATVAAAGRAFPVPITLVHEPRRGASHARNRGIAEATGTILALVDDDVAAAPDWLAHLVEPIVSGRCHATVGRVELDPAPTRPPWFDEIGIGAYLARLDLGPEERVLPPDGYIQSCNAAFLAEWLRATGGFDPRLGPRGSTQLVAEDNLVTRRIMAAGGVVGYVPSALVVHELPARRLSMRYLLARAYYQGRSDWILDRDGLELRRYHGLRIAVAWLAREWRRRWSEGLRRPGVAFHALTDAVRTAGAVREMAAWHLGGVGGAAAGPPGEPSPPPGAHGKQVDRGQVPEPDGRSVFGHEPGHLAE